jgi:hypothetical protein
MSKNPHFFKSTKYENSETIVKSKKVQINSKTFNFLPPFLGRLDHHYQDQHQPADGGGG